MSEREALTHKTVEIWRFNFPVTQSMDSVESLIVAEKKKDVGPTRDFTGRGGNRKSRERNRRYQQQPQTGLGDGTGCNQKGS